MRSDRLRKCCDLVGPLGLVVKAFLIDCARSQWGVWGGVSATCVVLDAVRKVTIQALTVKSRIDGFVAKTIHEHVARQGHKHKYSHITGDPTGRVLRPSGKTTLLRLTGDPGDEKFAQKRDNLRKVLSSLTVRVTYADVYGCTVGTTERSLEWFGRHFHDEADSEGDVRGPLVIESELAEEDQDVPQKPSSVYQETWVSVTGDSACFGEAMWRP